MAIDPRDLGGLLNERIVAARSAPWSGKVPDSRVRGHGYAGVISGIVLSVLPLVVLASMIQALHDDPLRARIAAPRYPLQSAAQRASVEHDIKVYPRDTRVRLAFAGFLSEQGRLADAERELVGALSDKDALRAIGYLDDRQHGRRVGLNLEEQVSIALAVVLAKEGRIEVARAKMTGLCPYVRDANMQMLIKLDLCHYR